MKNLKKWFFAFWTNNPKVSFLFIILVIISWLFSMFTIPKESSPDIKFWIISVFTSYPWVNPVDIDSLITEKIEKKIKDIDWIKKISSSSSVWSSSITVELNNGVNSRETMTDIKNEVDAISFPEDANDPVVMEISSSNDLMFQALLYWPREKFSDFYLNTQARKIQDALEWKAWIVSIDIWWESSTQMAGWWGWNSEYDIKVLVSKSKLEGLWLSLNSIANTIRTYNKNTPIWNYKIDDLKYDFRFDWEFTNIEELKNLTIKSSWQSKVKLWDISEIKKEYKETKISSLWFYNKSGLNYVWLTFNKKEGVNIFDVAKEAKKELEEYVKKSPELEWLDIKYTTDMSETIVEDYKNLWTTAVSTIILVFITILIFVWLRESLIASFLLPLSFLITFMVLDLLWLSLNFLTNFSLVLTLWIAIDTTIVIIEWASEKLKLWYSRHHAILLAVKDLKSPLISWTMTTLVAFLPLMFLPWIMWKFLSYIPTTVFSTLLAALILALTVWTAIFLKFSKNMKIYHKDIWVEKSMSKMEKEMLEKDREWKSMLRDDTKNLRDKFLEKLSWVYVFMLKKFLGSTTARLLSIFLPIVLLVLSFIFLSPKIWFILFPTTDNSIIQASIKAKTWTDKEALRKYLDEIDSVISIYPELKVYYTTISWNKIDLYIELINKTERKQKSMRTVFEIEKLVERDISKLASKWLKVEMTILKNWPPSWKAVWVKLIAANTKKLDELKKVSKDFEEYLRTLKWTKNAWTTSTENPWQFVFNFDKDKLDAVWLSPNDILSELYSYTFWLTPWSIKSEFEDNDIVLKIKEFDEKLTPEDIENLMITTRAWKIRLWDFASYKLEKSLSSINREDWKIVIRAESDLEEWYLTTDIQPKLDAYVKWGDNFPKLLSLWLKFNDMEKQDFLDKKFNDFKFINNFLYNKFWKDLYIVEAYNFPKWISSLAWWENEENAELIQSTVMSFFISIFLIFSILVFQFNSYSQPLVILYSVVLAFLWVNIWLYLTGNPYSMPFGIWFIALTWVVVNDAIILVDRINKEMEKKKNHEDSGDLKHEKFEAIVVSWRSRLQPIIVTTLTTLFWVLPLALQDAFWAGLGYTIIFGLFVWSFMTLFSIPALYYSLYYRK